MQYDDKSLNRYLRMVGGSNKAISTQIIKRIDSLKSVSNYKMGILEDLIIKICCIADDTDPPFNNRHIYILAGDHGIYDSLPDSLKSEESIDAVLNIIDKISPINVLSNMENFFIKIVDAGMFEDINIDSSDCIENKIRRGTDDCSKGPAMSREETIRAIINGLELIVEENTKYAPHIVALGEIGSGNLFTSALIASDILKVPVFDLLGDLAVENDKIILNELIEKSNQKWKDSNQNCDIIDLLSYFGGFETAAMVGAILGCALVKLPVIIDGFAGQVAALLTDRISEFAVDYMIAGHKSAVKGSEIILCKLGLTPVLSLNMEMREGTGAVLASRIIEAAIRCYKETGAEIID